MDIRILELVEGAREARGLTVIIDVLRAFSLECFLADLGASLVRPVGSVEEAFRLRNQFPDSLLIGERGGKMCEGFDFGNTPSGIRREDVAGKLVFHTTSAGTQGIVHATGAEEIITGSLVNAAAVVRYIRARNPMEVSLVAMGNGGIRRAPEDVLCAEYIRSMLLDVPMPDLSDRIDQLPTHGAEHFFDPAQAEVFPTADFYLCTRPDQFDFVLKVEKDAVGWKSIRVNV